MMDYVNILYLGKVYKCSKESDIYTVLYCTVPLQFFS